MRNASDYCYGLVNILQTISTGAASKFYLLNKYCGVDLEALPH